ncbi:endolytic transglycosylase MltG [Candidatus Roizmanbacteria bacterium CG_4_10_14_0_8_um_filter_39_9]|uniref:Endolytic murein transglycosylase n=1 Tax=Candidatus Roizmanbacteria bacterium CG_4_10_14_0_8_um_filter_39_9 TaxID=1974829 RepID=A0A2M7QE60_9BACT|nr:MAG: endolytic transglycosylase MltG [Candidatus Roizmanbacteria bacterium CG_4_10_14_0_8_um_filter_39_9]
MNKFVVFIAFVIFCVLAGVFLFFRYFGPVGRSSEQQVFIVPQNEVEFDITTSLKEKKLIKNIEAFRFLLDTFAKDKKILSGGYRIAPNMNSWQVFKIVTDKPGLVWVTVSGCVRKEQVGEIVAKALGWDQTKLDQWNILYKTNSPEYFEGVYYPDTYLIPVNETPPEVAKRFINRFNEMFAPYADKYIAANIRWTTGLKIASLIAREAAGQEDARLISGIIWNRLNTDMPLQIDATMQYTLGKKEDGSWWGGIAISEKQNDSPYNSYLYKGLPPTPICSPNIGYIKAALDPAETSCLFYLHDSNKQIHCAETYQKHLENIENYLN